MIRVSRVARSRRAAFGLAAFVASLTLFTGARANAEPEDRRATLDFRLESDVVGRSSAGVGFLERVAVGFALGGKTALIGGASAGAIFGDTTSFVDVSPYVGARLFISSAYALDLTASYHQLIGLDDHLEPMPGGYRSHESCGYGGTAGAAFSVLLGARISVRVSADVGAAAFDHDELYASPPKIVPGYRGGVFAFGGLGLVYHLPL